MKEGINIKSGEYYFISKAIDYIKSHAKGQLHFKDIAGHSGMDLEDFERLLWTWGHITPKGFLRTLSKEYLTEKIHPTQQTSLFASDFSENSKDSNNSELNHRDFTQIIPMTEKEAENKGQNLGINYDFYDSPFGGLIVGSTQKGVCYMAFEEEKDIAIRNMKSRFYNANFLLKRDDYQINAISIFTKDLNKIKPIYLHMKGTEFQIEVWNYLLGIPMGVLTTYGEIAKNIGNPTAARAVGTAIGRNPVAFIVPCHRVIQASGNFGGYMWGNTRKMAITAWEEGGS